MKTAWRFALLIVSFVSTLAIAQAPPATASPSRKVAILLFDNVENIDFTGPMQVFAVAGFDVFTVAADRRPVGISSGMKVLPQYSFADAPDADVVVIPGGDTDNVMMDKATLDWINVKASHARHVMSVCNGAFILAHTGLLDGLTATTTSGNVDALRQHSPGTSVVRDRRVVDAGKIITTGGFLAGIDGALHLVARLRGNGHAQFVAQTLEYDWRPDGGYAPAAYALRLLPMYLDQKLENFAQVDKVISSSGNANRWNMSFLLTTQAPAASLLTQIGSMLSSHGKWGEAVATAESQKMEWAFQDVDGKPWIATARVDHVKGNDKQQLFTIEVKSRQNLNRKKPAQPTSRPIRGQV
ncbi:DJ-1/PfpI family protein [Massilia sp. H6]|uniref:DJ-1/PfpI family protein n=1 Tax=Massilia sp. H6 TaxID=2970464 RepID=UPI002166DC51|nr:DJ-1/PfpI family protein [Massilia sp. H6]UVW29188.1 DJ-1/PfpI family protein [Massilia sp. H6]